MIDPRSRAGVVGTYQRHSFDKEKAAALVAWGAHVMALVEGKPRGKVDLPAGEYTLYCTVTGHAAQGMKATLTVTK